MHLDDRPAAGADVESIVVLRGDAGVGSCRFQQRIEVGRPDLVDRELRDEVDDSAPVSGTPTVPCAGDSPTPGAGRDRSARSTRRAMADPRTRPLRRSRRRAAPGDRSRSEPGRRGQAGAHEQRGDAGIDGAAEDPHELVPVDGHPTSVPRPALAGSEAAELIAVFIAATGRRPSAPQRQVTRAGRQGGASVFAAGSAWGC